MILPGPNGSDFADQDFRSYVGVGRAAPRHRPLVRELARHRPRDRAAAATTASSAPTSSGGPATRTPSPGQVLVELTRDARPPGPRRGVGRRKLSAGHGARHLVPATTTSTFDWFGEYQDFGDEFRADNGFVPQVGYREGYARGRLHVPARRASCAACAPSLIADRQEDREGDAAQPRATRPGVGMDGRWNSFMRFRCGVRRACARARRSCSRAQLVYDAPARARPRWLTDVALDGFVGEEVDFDNARAGTAATCALRRRCARPTTSSCASTASRRWLDVDAPGRPARAAVHRPGRAPARDLHVHVALVPAADRPVRRTRRATRALHRRGDGPRDGVASAARRCSPTSSTGRRCCSSATATTGPSRGGDARAAGPPVLPEAVVRVPALRRLAARVSSRASRPPSTSKPASASRASRLSACSSGSRTAAVHVAAGRRPGVRRRAAAPG